MGLMILGPAASNAIPELARLASSTNRSGPQIRAIRVLEAIGPSAACALADVATNRNSTVRREAIWALKPFTNNPTAFAVLTNALEDPDVHVQATAGEVLADLLYQ